MAEELATMHNIGIGHRDAPWPCMWFTVSTLHGDALQVLKLADEKTMKLIGSVSNVTDLEGHACVVELDDMHSRIEFLRLKK